MEEQIGELFIKIEYMEKIINTIQQNLNHKIQFFITMLGLIIVVLGGAVYFLVRVLVNERVDKELIKTIQNNPPILYFKGTLSKIQSVMSDSGQMYSEGIIDIDIEKYSIKDLTFPLELDLFYYGKRSFVITSEEFEKVEDILEVKLNLEFYNSRITEHGIRIWYKETYEGVGPIIEIMWTLKIPNPKYNNSKI